MKKKRESEICFISLIKRVVELYWTEIPETSREIEREREKDRERERERERVRYVSLA